MTNKIKIILAGAWLHPMYEEASCYALQNLGAEVIPYNWGHLYKRPLFRFEVKYSIKGPSLYKLNKDLINRVYKNKPDMLIIWLGSPIFPEILEEIKQNTNVKLLSYVHDDPFSHHFHKLSPSYYKRHWRFLQSSLKFYDIALFSKQLNVDDAYHFGAKKSAVSKQYFVPNLHKPELLTQDEKEYYGCDVVFAGHFEPDGRDEYLRALSETNIKVIIYADFSWKKANMGNLPNNFKIRSRVSGTEYVKALNGAKICLSFMSKMNRDQYTTRCFEIPACGKLLVSERTDELQKIFREDEEIIFFSSQDEFVEKIQWLLDNPGLASKISEAGHRRVYKDGHDVDSRMNEILELYSEL
jgi:spore maturation protein CgeB